MAYFEWTLDNNEALEPEMPLGTVVLTGDLGRIEDDNLMLDTFFEALISGLSEIRVKKEVRVDTIDEPLDLVFRRQPSGILISYGAQTAKVHRESAFTKELASAVEGLLRRLDEAALNQNRQPVACTELRQFLARVGS